MTVVDNIGLHHIGQCEKIPARAINQRKQDDVKNETNYFALPKPLLRRGGGGSKIFS